MYSISTEAMRWVASPRSSHRDKGNIRGVYLGPDECVEWFCVRDPADGKKRVIGYAIRKVSPETGTRKHLRFVK
ncbi:MAG: hypothetical protein ACE14T_05195 [Syntrophales bacterium]